MQTEAAKISPTVFRDYQAKKSTIKFLSNTVSPPISVPDDEHTYRKAARIINAALNAGDLPLLPWEEPCIVVGEMPGVPQHIHVPEEVLETYKNGREGIMDLFPQQLMRLSEFQATFAANLSQVRFLSRTVILEYEWLLHVAPKAIKKHVGEQTRQCFPSEEAAAGFTQGQDAYESH